MSAERDRTAVLADLGGRLPVSPRRIASSPATLLTFALLVVPFGLGWLDARLFSPLALPGYAIYAIGTAVGNAVAPRFEFWVYWAPFLAACAGLSAIVGFGYEWWRERRERRAGGGLERP